MNDTAAYNVKHLPWRTLFIVIVSMAVVGNSLVTLFLYAIGQPHLTAWTGFVPQATPSAVNDLLLGTVDVILCFYILRNCD